MRIYANLVRSWVVCNVYCSSRYQRLQISLMYLVFWPPRLTLELSYVVFLEVFLAILLHVTHCYICMVLRFGGGGPFYNLLIKYHILSWACVSWL